MTAFPLSYFFFFALPVPESQSPREALLAIFLFPVHRNELSSSFKDSNVFLSMKCNENN